MDKAFFLLHRILMIAIKKNLLKTFFGVTSLTQKRSNLIILLLSKQKLCLKILFLFILFSLFPFSL